MMKALVGTKGHQIMVDDVRWKQRFENFQRALNQLSAAVRLHEARPLTDLENKG